jgi:Flp pilus assembly protein CpaB
MRSIPLLDPLRRAFRWHRRWFAAVFAAIAVLAALNAVAAREPGEVSAVLAARDIAGGARLTEADLREVRLPAELVPEGAPADAGQLLGRTVISRIPERGVLTAANLLDSAGLVGPGKVAMPVRFGEAAALALLRVGGRIDVLGSGADGADYAVVASAVRVVALPASTDPGLLGGGQGALALVEVDSAQAAAIAAASAVSALSFALR